MNERTHVDLFTGIGGFSLAARANGVRTIAMCESDPRCQAFLAKAWPRVPVWPDVRTFSLGVAIGQGRSEGKLAATATGYGSAVEPNAGQRMADAQCPERWPQTKVAHEHNGNDGGRPEAASGHSIHPETVWLLTAGVPCQPASRAGKQRGKEDDRWLWPAAIKVFAAIRPAWGLFENPPGIGDVGLAGILSDLGREGYAVRVFSLGACALGAPHRRMRYWIVCRRLADSQREGLEVATSQSENAGQECPSIERSAVFGLVDSEKSGGGTGFGESRPQQDGDGSAGTGAWSDFEWLPCADGKVRRAPSRAVLLAHGLPNDLPAQLAQVHRSALGALGNSIVWPVAAQIIHAMIQSESP